MSAKKLFHDLIPFHAELVNKFHQEWRSVWESSSDCSEKERIAFFLLEHTAKLYRYTNDSVILNCFQEKPEKERRNLAVSACKFFDLSDTAARVSDIYASPDLDDSDFHLLSDAVFQLDSASEVLFLADKLSLDIRAGKFDLELMKSLAYASQELQTLDQSLRAWGDALLPVLTQMESVRELIKTPVRSECWWLQIDAFKSLDEANASLSRAMKELLSTTASRPRNVLDWFSSLFSAVQSTSSMYQLAAAASGQKLNLMVEGKPGLEVQVTRTPDDMVLIKIYEKNTREIPKWVIKASIELWQENYCVRSWHFDPAADSFVIPSAELQSGTGLVLRSGRSHWSLKSPDKD